MSDPVGDLQLAFCDLTWRVAALERLVVALAALAPDSLQIVRRMPEPELQGVEFLGRRHFGSAKAGTAAAQMYTEAWQKLISQIDVLYRNNSPSASG